MEPGIILSLFNIVLSVFAVVGTAVAVSSAYASFLRRRWRREEEETTDQRIGRLTTSLKEAAQLVAEIESEIKARHTLAGKLQSDIETYNRLVKLKQPEVEAVAQLLRGELQVERQRSFSQNVAINSVFFVLGAIVSAVLTTVF